MNDATALVKIAASIEALTADGHLAMPNTIVFGRGHVTILPDYRNEPVSALLAWAEHLDGRVEYDACLLHWGDESGPTSLRASGHLHGVPITLSVTTPRALPSLANNEADVEAMEAVPVEYVELLGLSLDERNSAP